MAKKEIKGKSLIEERVDLLDKSLDKLPPYQTGRKTGGFLSDIIDDIVDFISPKK